jgi:hypothetical protein
LKRAWLGVVVLLTTGGLNAQVTLASSERPSLQARIDQAIAAGEHRVVIPPGTYRLEAPPGTKAHLVFTGLKNFEIEATGVTLLLGTRNKMGIYFDRCERVTLRGATLIYDPIPFSQGKITAIAPDARTVDVQVAAGYPTDVEDRRYFPTIGLNLYDAPTRVFQDATWEVGTVQKLGPDTFRVVSGRKLDPALGWRPGGAVFWRGAQLADIESHDCTGMKVIGVTLESTSGVGFSEHLGAGKNLYSHCRIDYGPRPAGATEPPLASGNADGLNSIFARHGPTVEDCDFEGLNDDGIAFHGRYALVWRADGASLTLGVRSAPYCAPGDHLRLMDAAGSFRAEAIVRSVGPAAMIPGLAAPADLRYFQPPNKTENIRVTLDHPVPAAFGWEVSNADAVSSGFVIRRCIIRNTRTRGMIIKASDGLIEDCLVEGSVKAGIAITPELPRWNESDYGRNIVVRHNTLRAIARRPNEDNFQSGAMTIAAARHGSFVPLPGGFRNILVEGNTFENCIGPNLVVTSSEGVTLRDNRFVHAMWTAADPKSVAPGVDVNALIWLTEDSGLALSGNQVVDPGPFLKAKIAATATVSGTGLPAGPSK